MTESTDPTPSRVGYSEQRREVAAAWSADHRGSNDKTLHPDECEVCATIVSTGGIGDATITHCRGCCAVWSGHSVAHCVSCHRTFSTPGVLERHQRGYRDAANEYRMRCRDPHGIDYFAEPESNRWGVPIWRGHPRSQDQPYAADSGDAQGVAGV